jgi:hypothetical protein
MYLHHSRRCKNIIKDILNNDNYKREEKKTELLTLINTIHEQKYLQFNHQFFKQNEGLAMVAPMSAILAETFIQYLEHTVISKILNKHQILDYYKYVENILIIYNIRNTNIENTLKEYNTIQPKLKFTMEKKSQNKISYLHLTITRKHNQLTFGIYRKPTTIDSIIHNYSCHPYKYKKSAINYLTNCMNTYPLTQENKHQEQIIIQEILQNN